MRFAIQDSSDSEDQVDGERSWDSFTTDEDSERYQSQIRGGISLLDVLDDSSDEHDQEDDLIVLKGWRGDASSGGSFMKTTDELVRDAEVKAIETARKKNAADRVKLRELQMITSPKRQFRKQDAELTQLLADMSISHAKIQEELRTGFDERTRRLWDEVEATVREAERLHAEHLAGIEAGNRRLKEAEDAKAAAVQAAQTRKLEADHREQTARDAARTEAEAKRKQEKADAIAAEVKKRAAEAKAAGVATSAKPGEAAQEWERWRAKQTSMKHDVIGPVKADSSTRSRLRTGMRLITRGLGQVVNTKEAILRITDQIHGVLVEQLANRPSPSTPVSTEMNPPEPYLYLLSHTAKGLIKQAENEVNVKPDAAFPLARIVLGLLLRGHAVFGEILFARFVKKCPWVLPFYPPRLSSQTPQEHTKLTGLLPGETLTANVNRLSGIVTLHFAILQTPYASLASTLPSVPTPQQLLDLVIPPLRFTASWSWLALAMRADIIAAPPIATMMTVWLEVLGSEAVKVFGEKQMRKVWRLLVDATRDGKVKGDSEASRARLTLTLEEWEKGKLRPPLGRHWE